MDNIKTRVMSSKISNSKQPTGIIEVGKILYQNGGIA
jgi:hypothetical protein